MSVFKVIEEAKSYFHVWYTPKLIERAIRSEPMWSRITIKRVLAKS